MAPLTWREVSAPNFSGVSESQRLAAALLNNGFGTLSSALGDLQKSQQNADTGKFLAGISRYTTPDQLAAALQSGTAYSGVNPSNITADALQFAANRQSTLLQDQSRQLDNQQTQFVNDRTRAFEAARPEADAAINEIRTAYSLGTPEGRARGDALMREYNPKLAAAGYTPQQISALADTNASTLTAGLALNDALTKSKDANTERDQNLAAKDLVASLAPKATNAADLIRQIQGQDIRPEVMSKAVDLAKSQGETLFQTVDPQRAILDQSVQEARGSANPVDRVVNQIIGVESGGRADAKNPNSSAAGLGQFTDGTWLSTVRKNRPDLANASDSQILALKTDTSPQGQAFQKQMTTALTQENAQYLQSRGLAVTPGNIYLAHFAGQGGAEKVLRADPSASVESILGADAIAANPFLKGMSAGDLQNWAANKMNGKGDRVASSGSNTSAGQQATDAIQRALQVTASNASAADNQSLIDAGTLLQNDAQRISEAAKADTGFDQQLPVLADLMGNDNKKSSSEVAAELKKSLGDSDGLDVGQITKEINGIMERNHLSAEMAGSFIKNNIDRNMWGTRWLFGDRSVDNSAVDAEVAKFFDPKTGKPLQGTMNQLEVLRAKRNAEAQLQNLSSQVEAAKQEYFQAKSRKGADAEGALLRYQALLGQLNKTIKTYQDSKILTANTNGITGR